MSKEVDVIIHIDEYVEPTTQENVIAALVQREGVTAARFTDKRPHLMLISYDPGTLQSFDVLQQVRNQQLSAKLVGPI